jgi:hypothetical protein
MPVCRDADDNRDARADREHALQRELTGLDTRHASGVRQLFQRHEPPFVLPAGNYDTSRVENVRVGVRPTAPPQESVDGVMRQRRLWAAGDTA